MTAKAKGKVFKLFVIVLIVASIPVSLLLFDRTKEFYGRAFSTIFGTKANLVINLTSSTAFIPNWQYLAQGGEEKGGMLSSISSKVRLLAPKYIRLDHIYDFYEPVKKDSSGKLVYDWAKLDQELKAIESTGAKPFLSLSYTPPAISSGTETDLPTSWELWRDVVRSTIEHVSGRNGLSIQDVYYEVWNEPDLFGNFKLAGAKNYLTLYLYSSRGAEDAKNTLSFKFGGPATTALYKKWFTSFFDFAQSRGLRVDFYSWHRYSAKLVDFEDDISKAQQWLVAYPQFKNVEFIISESGHNSEIDSKYDTNFSAIHTMAMYLTTFQKIPKIFTFEIKDGPGVKKLWGRWGVLTNDKFGPPSEKPRFKAFEFLNNMTGSFYPVYGQGSWVKAIATSQNGVVRVLLVNYDPYSKHSELIPITFVNLPSKSLIYKRTDFLGSVRESEVNLDDQRQWKTSELMSPNSASILEIILR